MRIGEIAVISPEQVDKVQFIRALCQNAETVNASITFGRFPVNEQLLMHFYGINLEDESLSLDLISRKVLGYVILFRWGDVESFRKAQKYADLFIARYNASVIVAGHVNGSKPGMPVEFEFGIPIDRRGQFVFCNVSDKKSIIRVVLSLVDQAIDQTD